MKTQSFQRQLSFWKKKKLQGATPGSMKDVGQVIPMDALIFQILEITSKF